MQGVISQREIVYWVKLGISWVIIIVHNYVISHNFPTLNYSPILVQTCGLFPVKLYEIEFKHYETPDFEIFFLNFCAIFFFYLFIEAKHDCHRKISNL